MQKEISEKWDDSLSIWYPAIVIYLHAFQGLGFKLDASQQKVKYQNAHHNSIPLWGQPIYIKWLYISLKPLDTGYEDYILCMIFWQYWFTQLKIEQTIYLRKLLSWGWVTGWSIQTSIYKWFHTYTYIAILN